MRPVIALLIVTLGCSAERDLATAVVGDSADLHSGPGIQSAGCVSRVPPAIISLTVGQSARLSQNGSRLCFRLAPFPGSRYVLAYADPRLVDQAKTAAEWPWPDSVRVEVADITSQVAPAPPVQVRSIASGSFPGPVDRFQQSRAAPLAVPAFCSTSSGLGNAYCRTTPWSLGEVFTLRPNDGVRPPQPAKVVRISGQLVVAVIQADAAQLSSMGLARLDTALAFVQQRVLPFLARVYAVPNPVTTQESGQLLLMLESQTTYNFASFFNDPPDRGRFSFLSFRLGQGTAWTDTVQNANSLIEIIAHEMTHGFQQRWRYAHGPWTNYLGTLWAVEGSATFVQQHMAREFASVGFLSDFSQPPVNPDNKLWNLMTLTYSVKNLTSGYGEASSFLRDLVQRLVADQGMTFDLASRQVLVGALEGWYGVNEDTQAIGLGLNARLQSIQGTAWSPRDALLNWTMSQTTDQVTANSQYQNKTISLAGNVLANTIVPHGTVTAGSGTSLYVLRGPGTTGTVILDDNGVGGTFSVGGTVFVPRPVAMNQLEWLLLRIK